MCRLAGYVGPPARLSTLLFDPPRSLQVQSYQPREQRYGAVNVDGTGVAWWLADEPEPIRFRSDRPPWQDPNLPALSHRLKSGMQLAMVRSASPGIPIGQVFTHPFVHGSVAGTLNGWIGNFRLATARPLMDRLPDHLHAEMDGMSDAQVLFLLAIHHLEAGPGHGLLDAVAAAVREVAAVCVEHGAGATLNLAMGDGKMLVASRVGIGAPANSLYVLERGRRWPEARLFASEPLDDDEKWTAVPDASLVELSERGARVGALDAVGAAR